MLSTQTRNDNFRLHRESGAMGRQHKAIMLAFHREGAPKDMSLNEISQATGIRLSSVSGRVNELKALGWLSECMPRKDRVTGRKVTPLSLPPTQAVLFPDLTFFNAEGGQVNRTDSHSFVDVCLTENVGAR